MANELMSLSERQKPTGGLFRQNRNKARDLYQGMLAKNIQQPATTGLELGANVVSGLLLGKSLGGQQKQADELQSVFDSGISQLKEIANQPAGTPELQKQKLTKLRAAENSLINQIPREHQNPQLLSQVASYRKDFLTGEKLFKPEEVTSGALDKLNLTSRQKTEGTKLAKDIFGGSAIKTKDGFKNFVMPIMERIAAGENIDDISDQLRFASQSSDFQGDMRDAMQQMIGTKVTGAKAQEIFDRLDDVLQKGSGKALDFIRRSAIENEPASTQTEVLGKERTIEFLEEIREDLDRYRENGGDTNIFTGTKERVANKVGTVVDPQLRKIASKILTALQKYRRDISGKAVTEIENKEFRELFPDISRTANFNIANIEALQEVFQGDIDFFYKRKMGQQTYENLFKKPITKTSLEATPQDSSISTQTPAGSSGKILIIAPDGSQAYLDKADAQVAIQKGGRLA